MKEVTRNIIDRIVSAEVEGESKISQLWACAMIRYRDPVGDYAWQKMRSLDLPASSWVSAIAFLTGYSSPGPGVDYRRLVPELQDANPETTACGICGGKMIFVPDKKMYIHVRSGSFRCNPFAVK